MEMEGNVDEKGIEDLGLLEQGSDPHVRSGLTEMFMKEIDKNAEGMTKKEEDM